MVAGNGEHAHMQSENERWLNRDARCGRVPAQVYVQLQCVCMRICARAHELVLDRARDARMAEDIDHGG